MTRSAIVLAAGLAALPGAVMAETLRDALSETKPLLDWRLRYEGVEQTGLSEKADALTSRVRAGFETGAWRGTTLLGEAVWTDDVIDDFNDTVNGQNEYPVVPEPGGFAAVNRFAFTNRSLERTALTLGRQRIVLDDSRFVGNVGWRQNEQTFDGLRAEIDAGGVDVDLAYVSQVNRIFGPESPAGKWRGDIVLANVSRELAFGKLTGFVYSLDIDEAATLSTHTIGLRLTGSRPIGDGGLTAVYTASFAEQTEAGSNPADFAEDFVMLEGGIRAGRLTVALGLESLGGNGTSAVTMPLSTLHAFQGWADKFLATPATGIDDRYVRVAWQAGRSGAFESLGVVGAWHEFEAESGRASFGDELDLSIVARRGPIALTLKYAAYTADALYSDTDKVWFSMDYSF